MTAEYLWSSPGGAYHVPDQWRREFAAEFTGYRVRWSLKDAAWQIEQPAGRGALPPFRLDPHDDSLIRAADGFWLVMTTSPGDRMACPTVVTPFPRQVCGTILKVPFRRSGEVTCPTCRGAHRDGRIIAGFWPFDGALLDRLRRSDPLRDGTRRTSSDADAFNAALLARAEAKRRDAITSLDSVDYRWLTNIPTAGATRRAISPGDFT